MHKLESKMRERERERERECKAKDVRNIGESGLPKAASSSCHCSTAKREKSEVENCKEWMIPPPLLL